MTERLPEIIVRVRIVRSENPKTGEITYETTEETHPTYWPHSMRSVEVLELDDGGLSIVTQDGGIANATLTLAHYPPGTWISWRMSA